MPGSQRRGRRAAAWSGRVVRIIPPSARAKRRSRARTVGRSTSGSTSDQTPANAEPPSRRLSRPPTVPSSGTSARRPARGEDRSPPGPPPVRRRRTRSRRARLCAGGPSPKMTFSGRQSLSGSIDFSAARNPAALLPSYSRRRSPAKRRMPLSFAARSRQGPRATLLRLRKRTTISSQRREPAPPARCYHTCGPPGLPLPAGPSPASVLYPDLHGIS